MLVNKILPWSEHHPKARKVEAIEKSEKIFQSNHHDAFTGSNSNDQGTHEKCFELVLKNTIEKEENKKAR